MIMSNPTSIYEACKKWAKRHEENFLTITLNGGHEIIKVHHITKGTVNQTIIHPRECLRPAIIDRAVAVVFVHNHPSGKSDPSRPDDDITWRLQMASYLMGITMLDHVIISKNDYYSYKNEGKLTGIEYSRESMTEFAAEEGAK